MHEVLQSTQLLPRLHEHFFLRPVLFARVRDFVSHGSVDFFVLSSFCSERMLKCR